MERAVELAIDGTSERLQRMHVAQVRNEPFVIAVGLAQLLAVVGAVRQDLLDRGALVGQEVENFVLEDNRIRIGHEAAYPADLKARCGAIVHLDYQGTLTVARGLIRHDERDAVAKATRSDDAQGQAAAAAERLLEEKGWVPELMHAQPLQVAMAVEHPMEEMEE